MNNGLLPKRQLTAIQTNDDLDGWCIHASPAPVSWRIIDWAQHHERASLTWLHDRIEMRSNNCTNCWCVTYKLNFSFLFAGIELSLFNPSIFLDIETKPYHYLYVTSGNLVASGSRTKHNAMIYVPTFYIIFICKFTNHLTFMVTEL